MVCKETPISPVPFDIYCWKNDTENSAIFFKNMEALSRHKKGKVCMKDNAPWDEPHDIPDNEDESPDTTISVMDESCTE